jgi:MFS family permease
MSDPRRRLSLGLTIDMTVVAFEALAVATVAPRVARDLDGLDLYGWTFSAFMLASLVGTVVAGHAADRHGPAPPYLAGVALFTAGLIACGVAPTMPLFVVGRAIQGLGAGALGAIAYVTVGRAFSEEERPRQFAILSSAWVIPGLIAPGVGGLVAQHLGWRFVFLGLAALPALAATLVWPQLHRLGVARAGADRETGSAPEATMPIRAALALAIGAGAIVGGLGTSSIVVGLPLVLVGVAVAVPAFRRLTPPGTLRAARGMPAAVATRGLATFAFFGTDAFLAFALADVRHLSAVEVGLALTPTTITWTIGAWIQARTATRFSRRGTAGVGVVLIAVGAAATGATVLTSSVPVWVVALAWAVGGLGMGLSYSPTGLVVLSAAPVGGEGSATAAVQLTDGLGTALGTGIGGAVIAAAATAGWTRTSALTVVFAVMVAVGAVAFVGARRFPRDPASITPRAGHTPLGEAATGADLASGPHDDERVP